VSGTGYKALGFVVWKVGLGYLRWRYGRAKRGRLGAVALGAIALAGAAVLAQRRNSDAG
jgi:hypothetical protein